MKNKMGVCMCVSMNDTVTEGAAWNVIIEMFQTSCNVNIANRFYGSDDKCMPKQSAIEYQTSALQVLIKTNKLQCSI